MPTKKIESKVTDTEKAAKEKELEEAQALKEKELEEAQALLDAAAKEKAEASAKAAAKAAADAEAARIAAMTPEQRLLEDWPANHATLAPYITELGKVRGGLDLPNQAEAKKILRSYGFKV